MYCPRADDKAFEIEAETRDHVFRGTARAESSERGIVFDVWSIEQLDGETDEWVDVAPELHESASIALQEEAADRWRTGPTEL